MRAPSIIALAGLAWSTTINATSPEGQTKQLYRYPYGTWLENLAGECLLTELTLRNPVLTEHSPS